MVVFWLIAMLFFHAALNLAPRTAESGSDFSLSRGLLLPVTDGISRTLP